MPTLPPHHRLQPSCAPSFVPSAAPDAQLLNSPASSASASTSSPAHISTPQPQYHHPPSIRAGLFSFDDPPLFDIQPPPHGPASRSMQSEPPPNSWLEHDQLTPRSTTRAHHRESSLSSLGSAGPSSPYAANLVHPHIVGDYHEYQDYHHQHHSAKPPTPALTPSQEHFLAPHYPSYYPSSNLVYAMAPDDLPKGPGSQEGMAAPEFHVGARPSTRAGAPESSPATPPSCDDERPRIGETARSESWRAEYVLHRDPEAYRHAAPKLERTITDMYTDELYNPNMQFTSTSSSHQAPAPQNDVFSQRLQAANSQHLSAHGEAPLSAVAARDRSPFRNGSPLAPTSNTGAAGSPHLRFNSAHRLRQQQKMESDAVALQQQIERVSPQEATPTTISPKEVDLVYHETDDDAQHPLFPPQPRRPPPRPSADFYPQPALPQDASEDGSASQASYGSMATTRRESSGAYAHPATPAGPFGFAPPAVAGRVPIPQQYPFVPRATRQLSSLSNVSDEAGFPSTLRSMESSSSDYAADADPPKPGAVVADTGTYTCTYQGCRQRFESPAKLQKHKREGHRHSTVIGGGDESGMTSVGARVSQAGPHKCERINPSTGKPCNTVFSRPYDLTRHEDTIHNTRKIKVQCPLCAEEKTFSRNDALTRHLRVVHPEHAELIKSRRRAHD